MLKEWSILCEEAHHALSDAAMRHAATRIAEQAEILAREIENGGLEDRGGVSSLRLSCCNCARRWRASCEADRSRVIVWQLAKYLIFRKDFVLAFNRLGDICTYIGNNWAKCEISISMSHGRGSTIGSIAAATAATIEWFQQNKLGLRRFHEVGDYIISSHLESKRGNMWVAGCTALQFSE